MADATFGNLSVTGSAELHDAHVITDLRVDGYASVATADSPAANPIGYGFNVGAGRRPMFQPSGLFLGQSQADKVASVQGWTGAIFLYDPRTGAKKTVPATPMNLALQPAGGNVGIGTALPTARLQVDGDVRINDHPLWLRGATDSNHGVAYYGVASRGEPVFAKTDIDGPVVFGYSRGGLGTTAGTQRIVLSWNKDGAVGIGTANPSSRLEVAGRDDGHGDVVVSGRLRANSSHGGGVYFDSEDVFVGGNLQGGVGFTTAGQWRFAVGQNGNVGIGFGAGTTTAKLAVSGSVRIYAAGSNPPAYLEVSARKDGNYASASLQSIFENPVFPFSDLVLNPWGGNVGIGAFGSGGPAEALEVRGNIRVSGDVQLENADCAEHFTIAEPELAEPGMVMVMDDEGNLRPATQPYDRRVAGVLSGAGDYRPGIVLDSRDVANNRRPLALVGKAFCKVDAEFGPIAVGDLLTTSATVGYAMRAADPGRSFGAVIGKALKPCLTGRGLIPILVSLQ